MNQRAAQKKEKPPIDPKAMAPVHALVKTDDHYQTESAEVDQIVTALLQAQTSFKEVKASGQDRYHQRTYATLEDIFHAVREALQAAELLVYQSCIPNPGGMSVRTTIVHVSGQWIRSEIPLAPASSVVGQTRGSEISYARRQQLAALLCVEGYEDDNAGAATREERGRAPVKETEIRRPDRVEEKQIVDAYNLGVKNNMWKDGGEFTVYCEELYGVKSPRNITQSNFRDLLQRISLQPETADMEEQAKERF